MELMQQVKGNYSDSREEEEEEEAAEIVTITREAESSRLHQRDGAASNFRKPLDLMDLSPGSNKEEEGGGGGVVHHHHPSSSTKEVVEKEHMFDKVVTPSDVGKLNRLVIPKQHAEKYFPLDSSSNEKGLLLNFEDRNGKVWRFRYSYWNSSQSYVMTKGWSRFVKEKKLDAGDIVSFQRGLGDLYRQRLYIDWRRRPDHPPPNSHSPFFPWAATARFTMPPPRYHAHDHFHHLSYNNNNFFTFQQQQQQCYHLGHNHHYADLNSGSASLYYLRDQHLPDRGNNNNNNIVPMIIDSVPVAHHHHPGHGGMVSGSGSGSAAAAATNSGNGGKRLRLFGVNMECASSAEDSKGFSSSASAASSSSLQPLSLSARFGDQRGRTNSLLFDLDPSLQYRQ